MGGVRKLSIIITTVLVLFSAGAWASTDVLGVVDFVRQGGILSNSADYQWWHGCSPTSAGMVMGHYDRNGYGGLVYGNLVPGGVAEASTFVGSGPFLANDIIAGSGHITDFYAGGYDASGDDLPAPWHDFDCLADFMGTSQDAYSNSNGSTTFYYFTDGAPLTDADALAFGIQDSDGMYGIGEYVQYAGYDTAELFTQAILGHGTNPDLGFSFDDYMAEIDAGRPVIIQVSGHSMYGYGYDVPNRTVYLHDTWTAGEHSMIWGESYSGMEHWGVTCVELAGGVPEPLTMLGVLTGLIACGRYVRKRRAA